jgi:hypothetical protein
VALQLDQRLEDQTEPANPRSVNSTNRDSLVRYRVLTRLSTQMTYVTHMIQATHNLPKGPKSWISRALRSGWFKITSGTYDGGPERGVCPVAAGAILAGIWENGRPKPGNPEWGTENEPSLEIEDFAAYFDLCAAQIGTEETLRIVQRELAKDLPEVEELAGRKLAS